MLLRLVFAVLLLYVLGVGVNAMLVVTHWPN